jgi:rhodanese-related sulfurtransferase
MNQPASRPPIEVSCQEVRARLDAERPPLLLDCRERDEYQLVHIADSRLIPMSELQTRVSELQAEREAEIVVYCHHGGRSLQVAYWLAQQGFAHVQSLAGGIDAWSVLIDPALPRY